MTEPSPSDRIRTESNEVLGQDNEGLMGTGKGIGSRGVDGLT